MGQSERSLTVLGRRVAEAQDRAPEARLDRARGRARLIEAEIRPPRGAPWSVRLVAPIAAALVLAALAVIVVRPRDPLRFELGATAPGVVGAWIAAPPGAELPIRFSDGSVLRLARSGRARVAAVEANGAEVALERGSLDVAVVHRDRTRWTVDLGPFQIHVVGTRFETHWDPITEQFGVALREGAITVSGPVVGEARAVRAGERIEVSVPAGTLEAGAIDAAVREGHAEPAPSPAESATVSPPAPPPSPAPSSAAPVLVRLKPSASAEAAAASTWRALVLDARYKDALAAAEREGFDAICGSASVLDLRALGDAARLGGSPARAVQAFTALRARFPGSVEAASAAFILGRIAEDQSRDYAGAAGWFTQYMSEAPGGPFAADALGRLVEAEDKRGDAAGARRAAERYLAAYPGGPHAAYARRVLAQPGQSSP